MGIDLTVETATAESTIAQAESPMVDGSVTAKETEESARSDRGGRRKRGMRADARTAIQGLTELAQKTNSVTGERPWTIEDSEATYRIRAWGEPYFSINAAGHVTVSPKAERGGAIDLHELVEALKQRNLGLPLLIRFTDILADRIERLTAVFAKAIAKYK
jgi:arginine decarboxylase